MTDVKLHLEQFLVGIRPLLGAQGKDIAVVEASTEKIRLAFQGFCGGCGCSSEYVDGIKEMIADHYPEAQVEIEML
jgi:Fe-S cluster biogenesis protein NfuA